MSIYKITVTQYHKDSYSVNPHIATDLPDVLSLDDVNDFLAARGYDLSDELEVSVEELAWIHMSVGSFDDGYEWDGILETESVGDDDARLLGVQLER